MLEKRRACNQIVEKLLHRARRIIFFVFDYVRKLFDYLKIVAASRIIDLAEWCMAGISDFGEKRLVKGYAHAHTVF